MLINIKDCNNTKAILFKLKTTAQTPPKSLTHARACLMLYYNQNLKINVVNKKKN